MLISLYTLPICPNFYYRRRICYYFQANIMSTKRKLGTADDDASGKQQKLSSFFTLTETKIEKKTTERVVSNGLVVGKASSTAGLSALLTESSWKSLLRPEFNKPYFKEVEKFLQTADDAGKTIYPPRKLVFNALNLTPLDQVKVVIIGQDPYHGVGQAHGLSFSVPIGVDQPPSLKNIFIELTNDIPGFRKPSHGCLETWAKRGVLLLNASLTVEAHKANSHAQIGWQTFTDAVIKLVDNECKNVVFLLWGNFAHRKEALIRGTSKRGHLIIKTAHPSPLSVTRFFGSRCFSKANQALKESGKGEIDWKLE